MADIKKGVEQNMDEIIEKRDSERCKYRKIVDFVVEGRSYTGCTEDMSHSGAFIKTTGRFTEMKGITMTIADPMFESEKRTGRITRVAPDGIGVKFGGIVYSGKKPEE